MYVRFPFCCPHSLLEINNKNNIPQNHIENKDNDLDDFLNFMNALKTDVTCKNTNFSSSQFEKPEQSDQ